MATPSNYFNPLELFGMLSEGISPEAFTSAPSHPEILSGEALDYIADRPLAGMASDAINSAATGAEYLANLDGASLNPRITPEEWELYGGSARNDPAAAKFRTQVSEVFNNSLIAASGDSRLTAREAIVDRYRKGLSGLDDWEIEFIANERANAALRHLQGDFSQDPAVREEAGRDANYALDLVRANTPLAGPRSDMAITDDEYEEFKRQGRLDPNGVEARFRLNEAGAQAYQVQRDYDLLRTLNDGRHAPAYSHPMTTVYQGLGSLLGPAISPVSAGLATGKDILDAAVEGIATGNYEPLLQINSSNNLGRQHQALQENADLFANSLYGGVLGRINQGLYWYDRSQDAEATQDAITGGMFPDKAATTSAGFADRFNSRDNYYAQVSDVLGVPLWNYDLLATGRWKDLKDIQDFNKRVSRSTPIVPTQSMKEEIPQMLDAQTRQEVSAQRMPSATFPSLVYGANELLGTKFTPTYLSPMAEMGVQLGQEVFSDPFSFTDLLTGAYRGGPRGAYRAAMSEIKEESIPEYLGSVGEYSGNVDQSELKPSVAEWFMKAPTTHSMVTDEKGSPISLSSGDQGQKQYQKGLARFFDERQTNNSNVSEYMDRIRKVPRKYPASLFGL